MSYMLIVLLAALPLLAVASNETETEVTDPNLYDASEVIDKTPMDLLTMRGYEWKVHKVRTSDGYFVHVLHVINPLLKSKHIRLKRPVIFNHGFLECSSYWLINSLGCKPTFDSDFCPENPISLESIYQRNDSINGPMLLANHGYDVWLMSMRGTEFSQEHLIYSPLNPKFWDYSLDNFALDDIPSVVNYVLLATGATKVGYIGHSQATFSIFGLLSTRPHYADLIEPVIAVAPVSYMHHTNSAARALFSASIRAQAFDGPFPREAQAMRKSLGTFCSRKLIIFDFFCVILDALVAGRGRGLKPGHYSHIPFQSSLKVVRHFGQLIEYGNFSQYDHGSEENLKRYGTTDAPKYDIGKIRSRSICLFSTQSDTLSHPEDVKLFKSKLKVPLMKDVFIEGNFNHLDLITNKDSGKLVFGPILQIFEELESKNGLCAQQEEKFQDLNNHLDSDSVQEEEQD